MAVITTNLGAFAFGLSSHTHALSVSPDAESVKRAHTLQQISALGPGNMLKKVSFSRKFSRKKTTFQNVVASSLNFILNSG
jgi:hypothetical protein